MNMIITDRKKIAWAAAALFVTLIAAQVAARLLWPMFTTPSRSGTYAIFLTNNQVYFGTIANENESRLLLKGIYYIQFKGNAADISSDQSDVSLLKLGNELHGPEDWMEINRNQILFIERLKPDGKVAKAIESYKQK